MQRIGLILLGMASLVASGVILDHGRVGLNIMNGLGLQTVQGLRGDIGGIGSTTVLTKDDLLKQKFILDILQQIYMPLQQQDLLMLEDRNIITNQDLYMRPLTQEMQMVLDLIQTNQMLNKQAICNIKNQQHVLQTVGLYRLLVNARDFDTFKRLVVYARQNINNEMFVHCLILALGERQDTQMLIVPAFHEILPQIFIKDQVIDQVQQLDTGVSTLRPQIWDVMGMGRRNLFLNSGIIGQQQQQQQQDGLLGVLNRSQLWLPYRELHKQIALRKMLGGNVMQQQDKVIVTVPGNGLLSQDIGLKSYVAILIEEIVLNQDTLKKNTNYGGIMNENILLGRRGQRIDDINVMTGLNKNTHYGNIFGNQQFDTLQQGINTDRLLHTGRRVNNYVTGINDDDDVEQTIYGGMTGVGNLDQDLDIENIMLRNRGVVGGKRFGNDDILGMGHIKTRYGVQDIDMEQNLYNGNTNMREGQRGINTVSINDPRLLFVSRRQKNPGNVINLTNQRRQTINQQYGDEDDFISGGRHVSNDYQQNKYNRYDDDLTVDDIRYGQNYRQGNVMDIEDQQDDLYLHNNRGLKTKQNYQTYQDNTFGRSGLEQGIGMGIGGNRDDFLNMITRGRIGQQHYWNQNRGETLDMHLPTTNINDERLLHINRRKLNNINQQQGRVNNLAGIFDDNENDDVYDYVNKRYNTGYQGQQRFNVYDQNNQDYQDMYTQEQNTNNRGDKHGHRHRRSIINQELGQTSTINGKLLLHSLQQLVARLNIERIALGQPLLTETTIQMQAMHKIKTVIQQIDQVLQQQVGQITIPTYNQKINEIGLILAGQIQELGLAENVADILQITNKQLRRGFMINLLENEAVQVLLAGIVQVVDQKLQHIYLQRKEFINTVQGVTINHVGVDKLQTFVEQTDMDLTNLLTQNNIQETIQGNNKVVVGRVPRLNHKTFNIEIDVNSNQQQQVVIRNLLVPKVDGQDNIIPLVKRRQNVIVLDVTTAELQQGRNSLKLNSQDITITSRDTTPLTKIYQLVMQALNGNGVLQQNVLTGQSSLLPHRLLLPRGRTNGLPMHLITVITPLTGTSGIMGIQKGAELNTLFLDNLPLNYPLHCDITDLQDVISMSNLMVKDVQIDHDDNIKQINSIMTMY